MMTNVAKLKNKEKELVGESLTRKALRSIRRDKLTLAALSFILVLTVISLLAPLITYYIMRVDPNEPNTANIFTPPRDNGYILGADDIGRDQLARLLHAGGVSMAIGFFAAVFTLTIGATLGMISGYFGGIIDDVLLGIAITIGTIPGLFLLLQLGSLFGFTAQSLIGAITLISWIGTYRLTRGQTLSIREKEYIIAAQATGAGPFRIIFQHILPNLISVIVVDLALSIGGLILLESALSYLGYGVQPPQATWGNMLTKSQQFFRHGPHLIIVPGLMIFLTVLCFYLIGDGLRDAFDPTFQR